MTSKSFSILFLAWLVSIVSSLGSLFFSEVMEFPPCSLCWYQRICMYPLAIILAIGLFPLDKKVFKFAMPLSLIGWVLALYHNLLHWEFIPETAAPCREGVACSTVYIDWFGFVTIPLLSLVAFSIILSLLFLFNKKTSGDLSHD